MASDPIAMASNLLAMASNQIAMATIMFLLVLGVNSSSPARLYEFVCPVRIQAEGPEGKRNPPQIIGSGCCSMAVAAVLCEIVLKRSEFCVVWNRVECDAKRTDRR